jgi:hypothetical protein
LFGDQRPIPRVPEIIVIGFGEVEHSFRDSHIVVTPICRGGRPNSDKLRAYSRIVPALEEQVLRHRAVVGVDTLAHWALELHASLDQVGQDFFLVVAQGDKIGNQVLFGEWFWSSNQLRKLLLVELTDEVTQVLWHLYHQL